MVGRNPEGLRRSGGARRDGRCATGFGSFAEAVPPASGAQPMTVILPTKPAARVSEPYFLDMGGWQQGRGGDAVRLDQLGNRHGVVVRLPPMKFDDHVTAQIGRAAYRERVCPHI